MSRIAQFKVLLFTLLFGIGFSTSAQALPGTWEVWYDLAPSTVDWNSDNSPGCGTYFNNMNTTGGFGDFSRCVGGTPGSDNATGDNNHWASSSWEYESGLRLRMVDMNGDGQIDDGSVVTLEFMALEQHYTFGDAGFMLPRVQTHMHTLYGDANVTGADCPTSYVGPDSVSRTPGCNGSSADYATGIFDSGAGTITWDDFAINDDGQAKNFHSFGYINCADAFLGKCSAGNLAVGWNWKNTFNNIDVARVIGTTQAESELEPWTFSGAFDLDTAVAGDFDFSTIRLDVNSDALANSELYLVGDFVSAIYDPVPEPSTALMMGAGLMGLAIQGRRKKKV